MEMRIVELRKKKKRYEDLFNKISDKSYKLDVEIEELITKIIIDKKYLSFEKWILRLSGNNKEFFLTSRLTYKGNKLNSFKEILDLLPDWHHHSHYLKEYKTKLVFDDNDVTLYFDEPEDGLKFIKENEIKVDITNVSKDLYKIRNNIEKTASLIKLFEGVTGGKGNSNSYGDSKE